MAAGYGPLDADTSRELAALLAGQPGARWCITLTGRQGQAIAHGCARTGPDGSTGADVVNWLSRIGICQLQTGECSHLRESPHYRPPPSLRHLLRARQATCSFPGCRRPATRCDYDHTIPHDQGGRTCECNLAPLCRRHHRAKQAEGWSLTQPTPGVMTWTTPSGRSYATGPTAYDG